MSEILVVSLVGLVGWIAAAFTTALWLGERGRRKDLAWLVEMDREARTVTVEESDDPMIRAGEESAALDRDRLAEDIMQEAGISLEKARVEADRMINEAHRVTTGGW